MLAHRMVDDSIDFLRDIRDRPAWQPMPAEVRTQRGGGPSRVGEVCVEDCLCVDPGHATALRSNHRFGCEVPFAAGTPVSGCPATVSQAMRCITFTALGSGASQRDLSHNSTPHQVLPQRLTMACGRPSGDRPKIVA